MRVKDALGRWGEDVAVAHLVAAGLTVLDRNWRCPDGEVDVVARDGTAVVFVEVKTRSGTGYGDPAEAVTAAKAARIRTIALRWLSEHPPVVGAAHRDVRFDVVSVVRLGAGAPDVQHYQGAF